MPLHVLKFGSSVLRAETDLTRAVHEIARHRRRGAQVVAVVSALGTTTDELLRRAEQLGLPPQPAALAALLATGEAAASSLLTLALHAAGIETTLLDAAHAGLRAEGDLLDSTLVAVDKGTLRDALRTSVVVVPGFVGRDLAGRTALLGRGGSDFTALFLASELGGSCVLFKDVAGLYTADPAHDPGARRLRTASWATACRVGGQVVQGKAIRFAQAADLQFLIAAPGGGPGTTVGPGPDRLAAPAPGRQWPSRTPARTLAKHLAPRGSADGNEPGRLEVEA